MEILNQLHTYGSISSILGAVITFYILWTIRKIRTHFLSKARIPEILRSLEKNAGDLSKYLREFNDSQREIATILGIVIAILKNLKPKISGVAVKSTKTALKRIRENQKSLTKDATWESYNNLQALIEELRQYQKDIKWEK